jgi:hypothetical protein
MLNRYIVVASFATAIALFALAQKMKAKQRREAF